MTVKLLHSQQILDRWLSLLCFSWTANFKQNRRVDLGKADEIENEWKAMSKQTSLIWTGILGRSSLANDEDILTADLLERLSLSMFNPGRGACTSQRESGEDGCQRDIHWWYQRGIRQRFCLPHVQVIAVDDFTADYSNLNCLRCIHWCMINYHLFLNPWDKSRKRTKLRDEWNPLPDLKKIRNWHAHAEQTPYTRASICWELP